MALSKKVSVLPLTSSVVSSYSLIFGRVSHFIIDVISADGFAISLELVAHIGSSGVSHTISTVIGDSELKYEVDVININSTTPSDIVFKNDHTFAVDVYTRTINTENFKISAFV